MYLVGEPTMKSIVFVFCLLFFKSRAQNSCCPDVNESDVIQAKCNPTDGLNCTGTVFELDRTAFVDENFYTDGRVLVHDDGRRREFHLDFCLTNAEDKNGTIHEIALICGKNNTPVSIDQFNDTFETMQRATESEAETGAIVFRFLEFSSMALFMLTWIIYLIATKWHDLENQCVIQFLLNYNIVYFAINIICHTKYTFLFGITKAHTIYFFSISSFCWLSLIIFNTWKGLTFWCSSFVKTYLIYIVYAYGITVMMTSVVSTIITSTENYEAVDFYYILTDNKLRNRFFYTPIVIILTICFLPLVASGILIGRHKYSVIQNHSHVQNLYSSFYIYSTLFVIIGLIWLLEIFLSESPSREIVFVIDVLNSLQGVFTFTLLVVVRKTVSLTLWKSCKLFCSYWMWEPAPIMRAADEIQQIEQYWNPNAGLNVRPDCI